MQEHNLNLFPMLVDKNNFKTKNLETISVQGFLLTLRFELQTENNPKSSAYVASLVRIFVSSC